MVSGATQDGVAVQQASCQILFLDIGPIELNLLGLVIDISEIVIDITAFAGQGLLGDLLCALANLLNGGGGGPLGDILRQINQLLRTIQLIIGAL